MAPTDAPNDARTTLTLVIETVPPRSGQTPKVVGLEPDVALVLGKRVDGSRFTDDIMPIVEGRRPLALTLDVEHPNSVSSVQLLFWYEDGKPRVARPEGSQPVVVQHWGQAQRRSPLAMAPQGERLDMLTTLWLPASSSTRHWRWRIGAVNPAAPWPAPARGEWGTAPEVAVTQPTEDQLEMLLIRFGEYLHFPARTRRPTLRNDEPGGASDAYESRLRRVREVVTAAIGVDPGNGEDLLAELVGHGALRLVDVIGAGRTYGIELRHIDAVARLDDPRPMPRIGRHPNTRRLRPPRAQP